MLASLKRLSRNLDRIRHTHYPPFIFGRPLTPGEIPVFVYHEVDAVEFARDLEFLAENGYKTLAPDEFTSMANQTGAAAKAVLLTFDDARLNFWDTAFPLLQEYQARATLFVPTFWIADPGMEGQTSSLTAGRSLFMNWDQLRHCADSSFVEVQLHGHRHTLVTSSDRLVGFTSPRLLERFDVFEWPLNLESGHETLGPPLPGTPVFESRPLLSSDRAYQVRQEVLNGCRELVARSGGDDFFTKPGWSRQIRRKYDGLVHNEKPLLPIEENVFNRLLRTEFETPIDLFQTKLGKRPRYFAYPWRLGSRRSQQLARDFGHEALFGVGLDFHLANTPNAPVPIFGRYKAQWLRFLPGKGRKRLVEELPGRARDLLRAQHLAH